jgi:hypothetical protein
MKHIHMTPDPNYFIGLVVFSWGLSEDRNLVVEYSHGRQSL